MHLSHLQEAGMAVSIKLPPIIEQRLNQLAEQTGRANSHHLRELIERGLNDLENYYLADAAMERIRKGQETLIGSDQLRQEHGLDN